MIGLYIIGGLIVLLLMAIYGAINRMTKQLGAFIVLLLAQDKKSAWEESVKRFEKELDEEEARFNK